jgi:hypothetical protein
MICVKQPDLDFVNINSIIQIKLIFIGLMIKLIKLIF